MNEITRIHLAATPFNIEIGAKKQLEKYLNAIEVALQADEDTLREIEVRVIELLAERGVTGEKVITVSNVAEIERRLGEPADFADEESVADATQTITNKRLMRDEEKGILGGVLAGIAAYAGVEPIWVRVIAIILAFVSFGSLVLVYVVLWLVVPPARTATEKLQMAGMPVTLAAIKESASSIETGDKVKPLVVVLRVLLGLGFVFTALVAIGTTIVTIVLGTPMFIANGDLANAWLVASFVLFAVCGVLFTVLMILGAYASFAGRFTKTLGYGGLAVIVAGIVLAGVAFGTGMYGSSVLQDKVISITNVEKTPLSSLDGVQSVKIDVQDTYVEYKVTEGPARLEVTQMQREGEGKITADVTRDGEMATVTVKKTGGDSQQCFLFGNCRGEEKVVVYGPVLGNVEVAHGAVNYVGKTAEAFEVTVRKDASLILDEAIIASMNANVESGATLSADASSISRANVTVGDKSTLEMGVVEQLELTAPQSCPVESEADIEVSRVGTLLLNGESVNLQHETERNCAKVTISSLEYTTDAQM